MAISLDGVAARQARLQLAVTGLADLPWSELPEDVIDLEAGGQAELLEQPVGGVERDDVPDATRPDLQHV
jgi:hypothetical protein